MTKEIKICESCKTCGNVLNKGKNRAIISMTLGVVGFFFLGFNFIIGILAIIFGCLSRKNMKLTKDYNYLDVANAGIILGIVDITISCLFWIIIVLVLLGIADILRFLSILNLYF